MAIQTLFGSVPQEPNLLDKLKAGIQKTRSGLVDRLEDVLSGKKEIDADLLEELEYTLITADLGVRTVQDILERIRQRVDRKLTSDAEEIRGLIREQLLEILKASETPLSAIAMPPAVVMVVGVNGAGKTTTIGKLANRFLGEGRKVLLCAADTFRAAAIEQLEVWAQRAQVDRGTSSYEREPDGGVGEDAPDMPARDSRLAASGLAGAGCHNRPKRPGAGAEVHRIGGRYRHHINKARRYSKGWCGGGYRA